MLLLLLESLSVLSRPEKTNYPVTRYPLPATRYPLPATRYPLPVTRYPLPVTRYPLPAGFCNRANEKDDATKPHRRKIMGWAILENFVSGEPRRILPSTLTK